MIKSTYNKISDFINKNNLYWINNKEYKLKKMDYESISYLISDLKRNLKKIYQTILKN